MSDSLCELVTPWSRWVLLETTTRPRGRWRNFWLFDRASGKLRAGAVLPPRIYALGWDTKECRWSNGGSIDELYRDLHGYAEPLLKQLRHTLRQTHTRDTDPLLEHCADCLEVLGYPTSMADLARMLPGVEHTNRVKLSRRWQRIERYRSRRGVIRKQTPPAVAQNGRPPRFLLVLERE